MHLSAFSSCCVNAEPGYYIRSTNNDSEKPQVQLQRKRGWGNSPLGMGVRKAEEVIEDSKLLVKLATVGNDIKILNLTLTHGQSIVSIYPDREQRQRCLLCHEARK